MKTPRAYRRSLFILALLACSAEGRSQSGWALEIGGTVPFNVPLPLVIRQSGQPNISLDASYSSRPFKIPVCWIWRIGRWSDDTGWELQAIHHKLFLDNGTREVEEFSISHGLNIVTVNRSWKHEGLIVRAGAGIVLAHPENTVRGRRLQETGGILGMGYYFSGPALALGAGTQFTLPGGFFFGCEGMISGSYSNISVDGGSADVWNVALHANLALGYSLGAASTNTLRAGD